MKMERHGTGRDGTERALVNGACIWMDGWMVVRERE